MNVVSALCFFLALWIVIIVAGPLISYVVRSIFKNIAPIAGVIALYALISFLVHLEH